MWSLNSWEREGEDSVRRLWSRGCAVRDVIKQWRNSLFVTGPVEWKQQNSESENWRKWERYVNRRGVADRAPVPGDATDIPLTLVRFCEESTVLYKSTNLLFLVTKSSRLKWAYMIFEHNSPL